MTHRRYPSDSSSSTVGSPRSATSSFDADDSALQPTVSTIADTIVAVPCSDVEDAAAKFDDFRRKLLPTVRALREMHKLAAELNENRRETARLFRDFLADSPLSAVVGEADNIPPDPLSMEEILSLDGGVPALRRDNHSVCSEATTVQVDNRTAAMGVRIRGGRVAKRMGGLPGASRSTKKTTNENWRVSTEGTAGMREACASILEEERGEEHSEQAKIVPDTSAASDVCGAMDESDQLPCKELDVGEDIAKSAQVQNSKSGDDVSENDAGASGNADVAEVQCERQGDGTTHETDESSPIEIGNGIQSSMYTSVAKARLYEGGCVESGWSSYVAVQEEAFVVASEQIDRYLLDAVRYIEEWDKVVNKRVQGRIIECRRQKATLHRYEQKVKMLRAKACGVESCKGSPSHHPKAHRKLERNELKLCGAREAYESYSEGLFLLVEEVTQRGWMDFYPVLLKVLRFDVSTSSDYVKIVSRLNQVIDVLGDIGVQQEMHTSGRLDELRRSKPAELFTGKKIVSHRVCVLRN
eukprot:CAMPEP_0197434412 /NCGR_PEP_ID=MMETSP1175-20131217/2150_1 /TAXON_ID=1003142 /ORGANISM="Triceratium dubium, Strain CCMP147" /LENGTH=526 /DNA_ID=CAMNT_0042963125 /DNA_START=130 /DNA_END=1710 /DNA_ORIENTATION=+